MSDAFKDLHEYYNTAVFIHDLKISALYQIKMMLEDQIEMYQKNLVSEHGCIKNLTISTLPERMDCEIAMGEPMSDGPRVHIKAYDLTDYHSKYRKIQ